MTKTVIKFIKSDIIIKFANLFLDNLLSQKGYKAKPNNTIIGNLKNVIVFTEVNIQMFFYKIMVSSVLNHIVS